MEEAEPTRFCKHCQKQQPVRYNDYTKKDVLIFTEHYVSIDDRTICVGSGEIFKVPVAEPVGDDIEKVEKPAPAYCTECRNTVPTKINVRGSRVFAPHNKKTFDPCPRSYQRVV